MTTQAVSEDPSVSDAGKGGQGCATPSSEHLPVTFEVFHDNKQMYSNTLNTGSPTPINFGAPVGANSTNTQPTRLPTPPVTHGSGSTTSPNSTWSQDAERHDSNSSTIEDSVPKTSPGPFHRPQVTGESPAQPSADHGSATRDTAQATGSSMTDTPCAPSKHDKPGASHGYNTKDTARESHANIPDTPYTQSAPSETEEPYEDDDAPPSSSPPPGPSGRTRPLPMSNLEALFGQLHIDEEGNLLDSTGLNIGRLNFRPSFPGEAAQAPGSSGGGRNGSTKEKQKDQPYIEPPRIDNPRINNNESAGAGSSSTNAGPSAGAAASNSSEIYLDVKSTNDGIHFVIKLPTKFGCSHNH